MSIPTKTRKKLRIGSPCTEECSIKLGASGCLTCGLFLVEIHDWPEMSDKERLKVWYRLIKQKGTYPGGS